MVGKSFKVARVIKTDIQAVIYSVILCVCYCVLMVTQAFSDSVIPRWHALLEVTTFFSRYFLCGILCTGLLLLTYFC